MLLDEWGLHTSAQRAPSEQMRERHDRVVSDGARASCVPRADVCLLACLALTYPRAVSPPHDLQYNKVSDPFCTALHEAHTPAEWLKHC